MLKNYRYLLCIFFLCLIAACSIKWFGSFLSFELEIKNVMRWQHELFFTLQDFQLLAYLTETAAKLLFLMRSLLKVNNMNNWWKCQVWLPPVPHFVLQKKFYEICYWKCPPKSGSLHEIYGKLCFPKVAHCANLVGDIKYSFKFIISFYVVNI